MRIQKAELINMFLHLCNDMNKKAYITKGELARVNKWAPEFWTVPCEVVHEFTVGAWMLDYASCYGGWVIQECDTINGGIYNPFGQRRSSTNELYFLISFARQTKWILNQNLVENKT